MERHRSVDPGRTNMEPPAVVVRGVTKRFPATPQAALCGLSLCVERGEVLGLLGSNGAGKTTLLRILSGLLRPSEGTATVGGFDTVRDSTAVHAAVGALFGGAVGLYERLTARENIRYFASLNGVNEIEQQTDQMVALFGLEDFADRLVHGFSSGMKQRTALARAMVHQPHILMLDEPTTGLDITAAIVVQEFVLRCRSEGRTVLISSHNTGELERVCSRVVVVRDGAIVAETRPGVDIATGELRAFYLRATGSGA